MPDGTIGLAARGVTTAIARDALCACGRWPASDRHRNAAAFGPEFGTQPDLWGGDAGFAFNHRRDFGRLAVVSDALGCARREAARTRSWVARCASSRLQNGAGQTWIASPSSAPTLASYRAPRDGSTLRSRPPGSALQALELLMLEGSAWSSWHGGDGPQWPPCHRFAVGWLLSSPGCSGLRRSSVPGRARLLGLDAPAAHHFARALLPCGRGRHFHSHHSLTV